MKKLTVKQHALIQNALYVVGAVLAVYGYFARTSDKPHFTLWIALACVLGGVAWRAIFVKCPHCGDGLTGSRKIPKECPSCGKPLNQLPKEGE